MKVTYTAVGGLAPICSTCELDTSVLPDAEAAKLNSLVEQSGIYQLKNARIPGARDMVSITITVESEGRAHAVVFDAPLVPESVKPLAVFLRNYARDLLGEGA